MKNILITGATGFIGRNLTASLLKGGHRVIALSRNVDKAKAILPPHTVVMQWDGKTMGIWKDVLEECEVVINLAGENIGSHLWTEEFKQRILKSRVDAGQIIATAILEANNKPDVLLQASATGFYGSRGEEELSESSSAGNGFMAEVVQRWEESVSPVENTATRVVYLRTGVVLGKASEFIKRLKVPFQLFVGGPPGDGSQWLSWIHIDDEVAAIHFLMEKGNIKGPVNLVAPHPVQMKHFCAVFGKVLHRPSWISVPGFALKTIFGEFADEAILSSQKVFPQRLLEAGFRFQFPEIEGALRECLK